MSRDSVPDDQGCREPGCRDPGFRDQGWQAPGAFPARLTLACLLALATGLGAQAREPDRDPSEPRGSVPADDPENAFEFALGGDGLAFGYRNGLHRGNGYLSFAAFLGEDDDYAAHARLLRFGQPAAQTPFGLGVGIGLFGASVDEPNDEVLAITLTGAADYALDHAFELSYPVRVGLEASWAPDASTFADGTRVLDVLARVETDLSGWATVFVGYRHLEVDLEEGDAELDSAFQAGVRLGF